MFNVSDMKLGYVRGLEQDGAEFWLRRVGWEPSEVARKIAEGNDPEKTGYIADIGGGHGREALWLAEQGFMSILVEPNRYSLRSAQKRAKNKKINVHLISAALPYLPMCAEIMDIVDFYWTLHQIPNEHKLESLREIHRILKPQGTLHSTSFGYWEGHTMPTNIHPIAKKEAFLNLHVSAGFKSLSKIKERSDCTRSFEKFWYAIFQKISA